MSRASRRGLALVALTAAACSGSLCGRPASSVVYDLSDRLWVAERVAPQRQVVVFGAPASTVALEGFYREAAHEGEPYLWARDDVSVRLRWDEPSPRSAVVDLAPYSGATGQAATVTLNGSPVARLELPPGRRRLPFPLPVAAQRAGENVLSFHFSSVASPADQGGDSGDHRRLAAALYWLAVGSADDRGLDELLEKGAPSPYGVAGATASLHQVGPSRIRYAIRLPERAELRFTPGSDPKARAGAVPVELRVRFEAEGGAEQVLWTQTIGPGQTESQEVRVPLPGPEGAICRVDLEVAGPKHLAWGVWEAPRVEGAEGTASAMLLQDPAPEPAVERRAAALREKLRGSNVMLMFLDAARRDHLSAYGYERRTTPEIEALAREGVLFEKAFTPAVYTLAAMSSVWTSQYPDRHQGELSSAERLRPDIPVLSELLSAAGVHTAGFVANTMAGTAKGFERGFDEFHEVHALFEDLGSRAGSFRRVLPDWLAAHKDQRFFAYLHFREPHFPYDPPPPFNTLFGPDSPLTMEQRRVRDWYVDVNQGRRTPTPEELAHLVRLYDGNLAYADQEIGALVQALRTAGLLESTVVIVTADHGEQLYDQGYISHSAQVLEASIGVPLVMRLPSRAGEAGRRIGGLVSLLDLAPTILDVFGLPASGPPSAHFQGASLIPVLVGGAGHRAVLSRTVWEQPVYSLRDQRYKLIHDTRTGQSRLFDLQEDPAESRDVAGERPVLAAYYRQALLFELGRLRPETAAQAAPAAPLTRAECENLKALGYLSSDYECPES